jgi:hypothetical protein
MVGKYKWTTALGRSKGVWENGAEMNLAEVMLKDLHWIRLG